MIENLPVAISLGFRGKNPIDRYFLNELSKRVIFSPLWSNVSGSVSFYFVRFHAQLNGNMSKDIFKQLIIKMYSNFSHKRVSVLLNAPHQHKMAWR